MSTSPYRSAGRLLDAYLNGTKKGTGTVARGLKSLAFASKGGIATNKAAYATVCQTLRYLPTIDATLDDSDSKLRKLLGYHDVRDKGLWYVMVFELLFGKYKSIRGGGKIKRQIVKHEVELRKVAERYNEEMGPPEEDEVYSFPRYARINTLRCDDVEGLIEELRKGPPVTKDKRKKNDDDEEDDEEEEEAEPAPIEIFADAHVPGLLVLPPTASSWLHDGHVASAGGRVVLQDKSSCFSALVLTNGNNEEKEGADAPCDYIDACAAPGNKTSHLAALVREELLSSLPKEEETPKSKKKKKKSKAAAPKGGNDAAASSVFAFERNSTRFETLEKRMERLVPTADDKANVKVVPIHGDFLKSDPTDPKFANVRGILLDPSCSGSGIVNAPDRSSKEGSDKEKERIRLLSNFQLLALKHAMSFPQVERVAYSTCSVHEEENEGVVGKVLGELKDEAKKQQKKDKKKKKGKKGEEEDEDKEEEETQWELVAPACLDGWKRRGIPGGIGGLSEEGAKCLIRCDGTDGDGTNGFFVAYLERRRKGEEGDESDEGTTTATRKRGREGNISNDLNLPVYDGQFVSVVKEVSSSAESEGGGKRRKPNADKKGGEGVEKPKATKKNGATNEEYAGLTKAEKLKKKHLKKVEKKFAWKNKQQLQKTERLKNLKKKKQTEMKGQTKAKEGKISDVVNL